MTLTVAIKYEEGVVLAADQQLTNNGENYKRQKTSKIYDSEKNAYALSGDIDFFDNIHEELENEESFGSDKLEIKDTVSSIVNTTSSDINDKYTALGKQFQYEGGSLLFAATDGTEAFCYRYKTAGAPNIVRRFAVGGSAKPYARMMLKNRYKEDLSKQEAIEAAYFCVKRCKDLDPNVGGPVDLIVVKVDGVEEVPDALKQDLDDYYDTEEKHMSILRSISTPAAKEIFDRIEEHGTQEVVKKVKEIE